MSNEEEFTIEAAVLWEAIKQTFNKRRTELPESEPIALSEDFFSNESKKNQWKGFIRKQRKMNSAPSLYEVVEVLRVFFLPVVSDINTDTSAVKIWQLEQGWSRGE